MKIAINGFGRIGRTLARALELQPSIELIAINDLTNISNLAHLLKYDSVHGIYPQNITIEGDDLIIGNRKIRVLSEKNPTNLSWGNLGIDVVVESTGKFKTRALAGKHLKAGAKRVIISAPAEDADIKMVALGINDFILDGSEKIISNASCTTNSAAPLLKVLAENWTIEQAYITTVHSYTSDQQLHDAPHKDYRRGRAAAQSIVPTSTGAAKAITKIFPEMDGKIGGAGIRVPVANASLTDLSCIIKEDTSIGEINEAFKEAASDELSGILQYTADPIVSVDIIDNPHSCVFDSLLTSVLGKMVKVVGWYDNEWGYSNRLAELLIKLKG